MKFNCVISGIGGQGGHTLAAILLNAALESGYEAKGSELHGLAMRFGPIELHVRLGQNIFSPLVARGNADLIIALEPLEALRVAHYASEKTTFLIDENKIIPTTVYLDSKNYPEIDKIGNELRKFTKKSTFVKASEIAKEEVGSIVFANVYLLGLAYAKGLIPMEREKLIEGIKTTVPGKLFEANKKIFEKALL